MPNETLIKLLDVHARLARLAQECVDADTQIANAAGARLTRTNRDLLRARLHLERPDADPVLDEVYNDLLDERNTLASVLGQ